jgi:quercetin dioxygenase-like cupin family protein
MTNATVTIPRQADHSVTAAASELASRAQTSALKSWKVTTSSRLALMAFVVLGASGALADDMKMPMNGKDIKWGPPPPSLPKGAEFAVLSGDPGKDGLYVIRLKMPAGYKIPAHNHPTTENVTVVSGNFHIGMGDHLDEKKGIELTSGGFGEAPAKMNHYAWATSPTIVQVHGQGPFAITYVDPADDPSTRK